MTLTTGKPASRRLEVMSTLVGVTDDWLITEHSPNVALRLAYLWAMAVSAQARRIQHPHNSSERVPDTYLLVIALRSVLRAAEMAKNSIPAPDTKREIQQAIGTFARAIVVTNSTTKPEQALVQVRDVLEHFDEYLCGTGRWQRRDADKSSEDRAQDYRVDFEGTADHPQLRIGPLRPAPARFTIDLVTNAPDAARDLVAVLHASITRHQERTAREQRTSTNPRNDLPNNSIRTGDTAQPPVNVADM